MSGLVEKLEAAEVGSRSLDALICVSLQYGGANSEGAENVRTDDDWEGDLLFEQDGDECCNPIPPVTTSLDAALALAERIVGEDEALWLLKGVAVDAEEDIVNGCIKLLPLRLCAALLKSRRALNLNETRHAE